MSTAPKNTLNVSEIELLYRSKIKAADRPSVQSSRDAHKILKNLWDDNKIEMVEQFHLLLLNQGKVLGSMLLSTGGITSTVVDVRLLFAAALKAKATQIIVAHNHPSGNLKPSQADLMVTSRIKRAGALFDIELLDHLIIAKDDFYSMMDEGDFSCLPKMDM